MFVQGSPARSSTRCYLGAQRLASQVQSASRRSLFSAADRDQFPPRITTRELSHPSRTPGQFPPLGLPTRPLRTLRTILNTLQYITYELLYPKRLKVYNELPTVQICTTPLRTLRTTYHTLQYVTGFLLSTALSSPKRLIKSYK